MAALENLAVALIVLGCACFSAWRLMSARMRLRLLDAAGGLGNQTWMARLRAKTLAQLAGGCGTCSSARQPATPGLRDRREVSVAFPPANRKSAAPRR
jgi:hypothetical protein